MDPSPQARRLLDVLTSDGSRIFAEPGCYLPELPKATRQLKDFAPIFILEDGLHEWKIGFVYFEGYHFMIERRATGGGAYIVDDPSCPDEVLCGLADLLDNTFAGRSRLGETPARLLKSALAVVLVIAVVVAHAFLAFLVL